MPAAGQTMDDIEITKPARSGGDWSIVVWGKI
jgi:hypothetical protein